MLQPKNPIPLPQPLNLFPLSQPQNLLLPQSDNLMTVAQPRHFIRLQLQTETQLQNDVHLLPRPPIPLSQLFNFISISQPQPPIGLAQPQNQIHIPHPLYPIRLNEPIRLIRPLTPIPIARLESPTSYPHPHEALLHRHTCGSTPLIVPSLLETLTYPISNGIAASKTGTHAFGTSYVQSPEKASARGEQALPPAQCQSSGHQAKATKGKGKEGATRFPDRFFKHQHLHRRTANEDLHCKQNQPTLTRPPSIGAADGLDPSPKQNASGEENVLSESPPRSRSTSEKLTKNDEDTHCSDSKGTVDRTVGSSKDYDTHKALEKIVHPLTHHNEDTRTGDRHNEKEKHTVIGLRDRVFGKHASHESQNTSAHEPPEHDIETRISSTAEPHDRVAETGNELRTEACHSSEERKAKTPEVLADRSLANDEDHSPRETREGYSQKALDDVLESPVVPIRTAFVYHSPDGYGNPGDTLSIARENENQKSVEMDTIDTPFDRSSKFNIDWKEEPQTKHPLTTSVTFREDAQLVGSSTTASDSKDIMLPGYGETVSVSIDNKISVGAKVFVSDRAEADAHGQQNTHFSNDDPREYNETTDTYSNYISIPANVSKRDIPEEAVSPNVENYKFSENQNETMNTLGDKRSGIPTEQRENAKTFINEHVDHKTSSVDLVLRNNNDTSSGDIRKPTPLPMNYSLVLGLSNPGEYGHDDSVFTYDNSTPLYTGDISAPSGVNTTKLSLDNTATANPFDNRTVLDNDSELSSVNTTVFLEGNITAPIADNITAFIDDNTTDILSDNSTEDPVINIRSSLAKNATMIPNDNSTDIPAYGATGNSSTERPTDHTAGISGNILYNDTNIPDNTTNIPDNTTNIFDNTTNIPDNTMSIPDNTTGNSNNITNIPDNTTKIPDNNTNIPDNTTNIPDSTIGNPDNTTNIPINTTDIPNNTTNIPDNTTGNPGNTTSTPDNTTGIPDNTTGIPDNTTGIPDNTTGIPDNTTGIPDNTTGIPDNTTGIPDNTTGIPDNTTGIPDNTTDIPDNTTGIPDNTTGIPDNTTGIPDNTTGIPDNTTGIPDNTTNIPHNTSGNPGSTINIPDNTTGIPDNTTGIPDNTTSIPDNTMGIPDNTTRISDNTTDNAAARLSDVSTAPSADNTAIDQTDNTTKLSVDDITDF
ncbi:putative uncharacterized protein DDB_G0282133 [Penaeus japonicus]|uniref:putative uncharacterized protein DDB_G0282133 n=1 Tax=Penaeus japonicus TaxID=27405 RepID=UPI001C714F8F|nr:putative uncharacterized protein DDB_G0282133 [Penaeus japonicus]